MENNMSAIEKLFDENNNDNIVLYNDKGEATEFEQAAIIPLDGKIYAILSLANPTEDIAEDEGFVFEINAEEDHPSFNLVDNEDIINEVFELYEGLLDLLDEDETAEDADGE